MDSISQLRNIRLARGYNNVKEFSQLVGVSEFTYRRYEREPDDIPTKRLILLANLLKVSVDEILGFKDFKTTEIERVIDISSELNRMKKELDDLLLSHALLDKSIESLSLQWNGSMERIKTKIGDIA